MAFFGAQAALERLRCTKSKGRFDDIFVSATSFGAFPDPLCSKVTDSRDSKFDAPAFKSCRVPTPSTKQTCVSGGISVIEFVYLDSTNTTRSLLVWYS